MRVSLLSTLVVAAFVLLTSATARAETTLQLWTNLMLEWTVAPRWFLTFDLEPKRLMVGSGQWANLDFTTSVEFAATTWLDLIGELVTGYTDDSEYADQGEVTPRAGLRVYFIRKRFHLRDTWRVEQRNRFFTDGERDHLWRLRNRVEVRLAINRERMADPGAFIALADFEWFAPIERNSEERYASRYRVRAGVGYRWSAVWRTDLLYFFQKSRDTFKDDFHSADHIIDIRFRRAL